MCETAEIKNRGCAGIKRMEVREGNKHKINITHRDTKVYETKTGVHIVRVKSNPINKKKKKTLIFGTHPTVQRNERQVSLSLSLSTRDVKKIRTRGYPRIKPATSRKQILKMDTRYPRVRVFLIPAC